MILEICQIQSYHSLLLKNLTGDNFAKWKYDMNIILVLDNLKFVLIEECPPKTAVNANKNIIDAYENWVRANDKARCYLLAYMSDVLKTKLYWSLYMA